MRLAALFSGGKDSTFAVYMALKEGHSVEVLLSMKPKSAESFMFHYPNVSLTELQAGAMEIPLHSRETLGVKEEELEDLKTALKELKKEKGIEGVVSGALASNYQKKRIDSLCAGLGLKSFAPLWGKNQKAFLKELLEKNFEVLIVAVAAKGLGEEWLGRRLDEKAVHELAELEEKFQLNPAGEGGEFESLVIDCPLFKKKLKIIEAEKSWTGAGGEYKIKKAELEEKG